MAQNPYNNYIKRQQQKPMNNFKEKVKNSLGGVQTNNTVNTPATNPTTPSVSHSKPIQPYNNTNTPKANPNPTTPAPVAPQGNGITPQALANATANQPITTPAPTQPTAPTQTVAPTTGAPTGGDGTGMMSLSDVNNAFTPQATQQGEPQVNPQDAPPISQPITPQEVEQVANDPQIQRQAYAEGKTPQQMAQELLEEQKKALQADWEFKQQQFQEQQKQAQEKFDQSKVDAENAYGESIDAINQDRYNRQQDLNVSGSNRGIQYSPQQLGLETVANINTNKNITEAGKQRNELLNKLTQQLNQLNADILMSSQSSINDYNQALAKLQSDYANKIMDWEWNQQQTDAERAWQEKQTEADRAFQEKMQNAQNAWQSGENKLDRDKGRSGGGGGGYSYGGGSGWKNYGGYSRGSYSRMGEGWDDDYFNSSYNNDLDFNDEITQQTIDNDFKKLSTDAYNATQSGGMGDLMERGGYYDEFTSPMYNEFSGKNETVDDRLNNTRETALKHMYNKAYARDTNGEYKLGNTVYTNTRPLRQDYMDEVKSNRVKSQADFYSKFSNDPIKKMESAKTSANYDRYKEMVDKANDYSKKNPKSSKQSSWSKQTESVAKKQSESVKKVTNKVKEVSKKVEKSTKNSAKNVKKSTANAKKNSKTSGKNMTTKNNKAMSNSAKNVKKSTSKSAENLKKSVNKVKDKIKNTFKKKDDKKKKKKK